MHCFNCLEGLKQTSHDYQICCGEVHLSLVNSVLSAVLDRHNFCTNLYLFLHRWRQEVSLNKRGSQWKWSEMPLVNCMDREVRREFVWQGGFFSSSPMSDFLRLALKENLLLYFWSWGWEGVVVGGFFIIWPSAFPGWSAGGQVGWGPILSYRRQVSSGRPGPWSCHV